MSSEAYGSVEPRPQGRRGPAWVGRATASLTRRSGPGASGTANLREASAEPSWRLTGQRGWQAWTKRYVARTRGCLIPSSQTKSHRRTDAA